MFLRVARERSIPPDRFSMFLAGDARFLGEPGAPRGVASGGAAAADRRRRRVVVAGPGQGKAGKTGPGQTKPRQGTTSKPAKPRQAGLAAWLAKNCPRTV